MGAELTDRGALGLWDAADVSMPLVSWLDERTASLMGTVTEALACEHPAVVAVILFGSIARHDERPLDDSQPSDVDLLVLDGAPAGTTHIATDTLLALCHTVGEADYHFGETPRDVQTVFANWDLADWDAAFVQNVARDGILLWARGPLPTALAPVAERAGT